MATVTDYSCRQRVNFAGHNGSSIVSKRLTIGFYNMKRNIGRIDGILNSLNTEASIDIYNIKLNWDIHTKNALASIPLVFIPGKLYLSGVYTHYNLIYPNHLRVLAINDDSSLSLVKAGFPTDSYYLSEHTINDEIPINNRGYLLLNVSRFCEIIHSHSPMSAFDVFMIKELISELHYENNLNFVSVVLESLFESYPDLPITGKNPTDETVVKPLYNWLEALGYLKSEWYIEERIKMLIMMYMLVTDFEMKCSINSVSIMQALTSHV